MLFKSKSRKYIFQIILILLTLLYLYPFYTVITISVKTPREALFSPMSFPKEFYWENFKQAWEMMNYPVSFMNSFIITLLGSLGISLVAGMGSFTLSMRSKSKVYKVIYYIFISGLMVPFHMTLSPLVKLIKDTNLMDSRTGMILVYIGRGIPFAILMYVGFIDKLPKAVIEAATIDGCTPLNLFWRVILPMTAHIGVTLIILNTLWIWNDFLLPVLVLQTTVKRTIPLSQYIFYGMYSNQWNLAFASYLLSMLPLLIVYFFLQRYIIEGIATGSVKG